VYTIRTDGSGLSTAPLVPESVQARPTEPVFGVSRPSGRIVSLALAAPAENRDPDNPHAPVVEVFRIAGGNLLQLSSFGRYDTSGVGTGEDKDSLPLVRRGRVLLIASEDPFGENPFQDCQFFSIDSLGGGLRQLTHFADGAPAVSGCGGASPGCSFADVYQDPVTRWIVFYSSCAPFGGPFGGQLFTMRPDGKRLRQLTHTAGARFGPGDEVEVEIPGPTAYSMPTR
jgi:hypothetical protein